MKKHSLIFAVLTEKTSEISFGIVRYKKQRESPKKAVPHTTYVMLCTRLLAWSILIWL